jgi:IclR family acetate operon transcriptional repressor
MAQAEKGDNVRAVGRALEILLAFKSQDTDLSVSDLLKRVDLSRPTLYRLIYTLEEHGFLSSYGDPQKFRLGPSVAKLAHVWNATLDLAGIAEPVMRKIWEATGETVALFISEGESRLCISEIQSNHPLNFKRGVGYSEKIERGATGRAILASRKNSAADLKHYSESLKISIKKLEGELDKVRQLGYSTSHNELIQGAVAIAVPFFDKSGDVAGSIGVFGPEVRMNKTNEAEIVELLKKEAVNLSKLLGWADLR